MITENLKKYIASGIGVKGELQNLSIVGVELLKLLRVEADSIDLVLGRDCDPRLL